MPVANANDKDRCHTWTLYLSIRGTSVLMLYLLVPCIDPLE